MNKLGAQIMNMLEEADEAAKCMIERGLESSAELLKDLCDLTDAIHEAMKEAAKSVKYPNKLLDISVNAPFSVKRLLELCKSDNIEEAAWRLKCETVPLIGYLQMYADYWLIQCTNDDEMKAYNERELELSERLAEEGFELKERDYKYDISVVVLFYGKKEMTAKCIDAIKKYTVGYTYELITVDNGSDEETTAWCNSLDHVKKIHFKHNMGSSAGGNFILSMAGQICEGKYLAFFSNDVIATENYIKSLYECLESDKKIVWATPVCNSLSKLQTIPVPYKGNDIEAMQEFAREYNSFNPKKWYEMTYVYPILGVYRYELLCLRGLNLSPYFCYDMAADDDASAWFRRCGFKQVLCRDVFVHHYNAATLHEGRIEALKKGHEQFYKKYGATLQHLLGMECFWAGQAAEVKCAKEVKALVINPRFGSSALELKNRLIENGCEKVRLYGLTDDKRYLPDMRVIFDKFGMAEELGQEFKKTAFDIVLLEGYMDYYNDLCSLLSFVADLLKKADGRAYLQIRKRFSLYTLRTKLLMPGEADNLPSRWISKRAFNKELSKAGLKALSVIKDFGPAQGKSFIKWIIKLLIVLKSGLMVKEYRYIIGVNNQENSK